MSLCVPLAAIEQGGTDSAAREVGMNKERSNLRGLGMGVQQGCVALGACIAPEECPTPAPAAATHQLSAVFDHEVAAIADQLSVDAKGAAQRPLDLGRAVVVGAERPGRQRDERFELSQIAERGGAQVVTLIRQEQFNRWQVKMK